MSSVAAPHPHPDFGLELVRDWVPEESPLATFVLVHGLGEHSGRYERTGGLLADAGFHVRAFDLVGAGGSGGRRWYVESLDQYLNQIGQHLDWARRQGRPVVLLGHSMGGLLGFAYLTTDRTRPDLYVASAPALAGGTAVQRATLPTLARLLPTMTVPTMIKGEQLSRDPAVGEAYFADPLVATKVTTGLGAVLLASLESTNAGIEGIGIPTLVLHGGMDTVVPAWATARLADLPGFERRLYPSLRHEILNEPEGPGIVAEIIEWVTARV